MQLAQFGYMKSDHPLYFDQILLVCSTLSFFGGQWLAHVVEAFGDKDNLIAKWNRGTWELISEDIKAATQPAYFPSGLDQAYFQSYHTSCETLNQECSRTCYPDGSQACSWTARSSGPC